MRTYGLACLFLMAAPLLYSGVMEDFGPFPDAEKVVRVSLQPCTLLRSTTTEGKTVEEFGLPGETQKPFLTIEVDNPNPEQYLAILKMDLGPKEPSYEGVLEKASWFMDVLTADLNGDTKPDLVIPYTLRETGGIGADEEGMEAAPSRGQDVLFALSGKERYRFIIAPDVQFDEKGFFSLLNDETVQWVHTRLVAGPKPEKDAMGRTVSFYLHRLFHIQGDGLAAAEGMDDRFPKTVSYYPGSRRKNHKETKLLTDAEKKALLDAHPAVMTEWNMKVILPAIPTPVPKKKPPLKKRPATRPAVKKPVTADATPAAAAVKPAPSSAPTQTPKP